MGVFSGTTALSSGLALIDAGDSLLCTDGEAVAARGEVCAMGETEPAPEAVVGVVDKAMGEADALIGLGLDLQESHNFRKKNNNKVLTFLCSILVFQNTS